MPGKLNFVTQKLRSYSVPQLDMQKADTVLSFQPIAVVEEPEMSETESKNIWFKTWPERSYDKLEQSNDTSPEDEDNSFSSKSESVKSHIPLNKLLDNIPLAYSPITRQLHVLTPSEQRKDSLKQKNNELSKGEISNDSEDEFEEFQTKSAEDNPDEMVSDHSPEKRKNPAIMLDLSHNLGKDLVLQSCLKRLELSPNEQCSGLWNSKIGYSERKNDDFETIKNDACNLKTEASSFSSIVSSLSDGSPSNLDETASGKLSFMESDDLSIRSHCSHDSGSTYGENSKFFEEQNTAARTKCDTKRKGLSGFFSRNVFTWKTPAVANPQGWKLFSRSATQEATEPNLTSLGSHEVLRGSQLSITDSPLSSKKYEDVVASSSALILHNRPANLPAKSVDEEQKHRWEYQQMVEAARKRELKETKQRKKQLQQQLKVEEQLANAARIWNNEILPKWDIMKNSRKARDLWWNGIPPCVRGKVWKLAIGNELNITYQLYEICVARAQERLKVVQTALNDEKCPDDTDKESSVELIQLDISRTFPNLCIFQKGGPYYDILHCLLGAYVCYRPDVGYVQGMSFLAAILILNLEAADAFICFSNLLNRPCHMAFFSLNQAIMEAYYSTYNDFFRENLPRLHQHFLESSLTPDLYLLDWVYSVFAKAMPLDVACRIWDVFLRDGEEFLFRTALGVLHLHQEKLIKLDFINGAQFLTKLPEDLSSDLLFKSIDAIKMNVGKQKYSQVLAVHIEKCSVR